MQDLQFHADQGSKDVMQGQFRADQRFTDVIQRISHADKKSKDVMKSRSSQTVKLSAKAREALNQDPPNAEIRPDIENLILYLKNLLNSWDADKANNNLQSDQPDSLHEEDPIILLATKINSINARNYDQFVCTTQFDIKEPETYARAMQGLHAAQWVKTIEEELDQLY